MTDDSNIITVIWTFSSSLHTTGNRSAKYEHCLYVTIRGICANANGTEILYAGRT